MALNLEEIKKYLYPEEFNSYLSLMKIFENNKYSKSNITLFYPGCGADVVNPLLFLDILLDWKNTRAITLIYADTSSIAPMFIGETVDKITGVKNVVKFISEDEAHISFTINNCRITLVYILADVLQKLPQILDKGFDIYFERAFEIFRADEAMFIRYVLEHVNKNGLLISDCGFCRQDMLKKYGFVDFGPKKLPSELGLYNTLKIYKKEKD